MPAERVQERREPAGIVEAALGEVRPALLLEDAAVDLVVPEDPERLPLSIVVGAGQRHDRRGAGDLRRGDLLHQPTAGTDLYQLADLGWSFRERADRMGLSHFEWGKSAPVSAALNLALAAACGTTLLGVPLVGTSP